MNWSDWLRLDPKQFERRLRRRLSRPIAHNDFIQLYNDLAVLAPEAPGTIADLSGKIAALFETHYRVRDALLFWELKARSSMISGGLDGTFDALRRMADLDSRDQTRRIVLKIAEEAAEKPDRFGRSVDQRPRVFAAVSEVYRGYNLLEKLARLYLEAAALYSRHGASQAAYRSISDAEEIARDSGSTRLLAEVYGVAASTACEEGDPEWAVGAAERALSLWESIGEDPPAVLLSNLGVARMRLGQHEEGASDLRAAIGASGDESLASTIKINLAACLRAGGNLDGAWTAAREAHRVLADDSDPERRLELALIMARIASERQEITDLAHQLTEASRLLDLVLGDILRLHHRRGIRERYVPRIEHLLGQLPTTGPTNHVLLPIAAARLNALGDWLSILDWADGVSVHAGIELPERAAVATTISALRNFGAPHLFGFREKYDDAWEPMNGGSAWDDLSTLAARIEAAGLGQPLSNAKLAPILERCRRRLREGHCLMALTYAGHRAILWCFVGDRYLNAQLPLDTLKNWKAAVLAHASGELDRVVFNERIGAMLDETWAAVEPLLNFVADAGAQSIRFIQDFADSLPMTALAARHSGLAVRMAAGEFHVRIVPALYDVHETALSNPSVIAVTDATEDLLLPRFEGCALASEVEASELRQVDAADQGSLVDLLEGADVVLVSTHSSPLQFYTDPFFAHMGASERGHLIGIEALQMSAPDLSASLILLNACYAGSGSARNFQHDFRTSDLVTYPALLTMSRCSIISAGAWKTSDTVAYLHTLMVAEALRAGHTPACAIGVSIARLPRLTKSLAVEMLGTIPDPAVRVAAVARLAEAPERGLFSQPYVSGGIAVHGLL